ncbi:uncharacterized protein BX663DRAFT_494033 [Cokeromyces recurvatus]|uniref:uncharacterized protein n=1 Tax=Cokeromyces recurvatus TaxID=90255 RepID=UPI00222034EE|nr:uncharacterized protein BX663DRAFT_494033 [Cokeromyces recurvatus]KAI7906865.1 hypothetical protein BX663DRAFT_494033 [Cokeromyces recurvatus]
MSRKRWFDIFWKSKDNEENNSRDRYCQGIHRRASTENSQQSAITTSTLSHTESTAVKLKKITNGGRRIFINLPLSTFYNNATATEKKRNFATNKIRTSKYTLLSFIPKNLFEQFRRPANMYFLAMAIIQMLPQFGVKSPALTLLPICFVVFVTAVKDGFEDFQRHKVDKQYNQNITHTLRGYHNTNFPYQDSSSSSASGKFLTNITTTTWLSAILYHLSFFKKVPATGESENVHDDGNQQNLPSHAEDVFERSLSKDIRVGDFILLRNGDSLPADAVLLSTSDKEGICYVETKDLDGEINLKPRKSIRELSYIQSGADCLNDCHFYLEAGAPSPDLYHFEGTLVRLERDGSLVDKWIEKSRTPVGIENILLRGHVVKNTKWAIAVVLFTGVDSKIMLNSGETPSKRSRVDKQMNQEIFIAFLVLFILCLICAIMAGVKRSYFMSNTSSSLFAVQSGSPAYVGFMNFWSSLIIFQNIIPISLYVSIEFVKTFQAFFIWNDLDMWDESSQKSCVPKTWILSDDLGQVEYIFSDKTGTLTRNIMEFRECTIGGVRYGNNGFAPESEGARGARIRKEKEKKSNHNETNTSSHVGHDLEEQREAVMKESTENHLPLLDVDEDPLKDNDEKKANKENKDKRLEIMKDYEATMKNLFQPTYSSLNPNRLSFADPQLFKDIESSEPDKELDKQSAKIKEFFMLLALCHTVMVERIGEDGKVIEEEEEEDDDDDDKKMTKQEPKISENMANGSYNKLKNTIVSDIKDAKASDENAATEKMETSNYKSHTGSTSKLLSQVPGIRHLKKSSDTEATNKRGDLRRKKSRGEEFNSITDEKQKSDQTDDTVRIQLNYKAESPDEAALVNAAKNAGFVFLQRKGETVTADIVGKEYQFELLNVLEFNSDRKRMSVILRRPEPWNDIILYCKGADNVISERLDKSKQEKDVINQTFSHVNEYSECGLRTLLASYRLLEEDEYKNWKSEYDEASTAYENRSDKIAEVQEKIEVNLRLLGATGIEDKLQEGVPKCIEDLRNAGIKIWVLTGDKLETAINIGYASNLLDANMKLWVIHGSDSPEKVFQTLTDTLEKLDNRHEIDDSIIQENALIIEGSSLAHILKSSDLKIKLLQIATHCKSVICCRVSPLQKALVVQLVRKHHDTVTLAVGDGANDVSMIQAANVGVGIAGQEGVQASMAADYAISQFRFLHKLLLVQGHWSYSRISEMILTFFFKNVFWVFPSLWYQIYSAWSGNIFYDYSFLQLYNIVFTVAPVVILGATDQDLTSPYLKHLTSIYSIRGKLYTKFRFWLYFLDGVWQSVIVFYAFYLLYINGNPNSNGYSESMLQLSTSVAVTAITLANIMPGFNTYYWTWWQFTFIGLELLVTFLWVVIYGAFPSVSLWGMANMVFGQGSFWLTYLLVIIFAFLPRYTITFIYQWWYPNVIAKGRQFELYDKRIKKKER